LLLLKLWSKVLTELFIPPLTLQLVALKEVM